MKTYYYYLSHNGGAAEQHVDHAHEFKSDRDIEAVNQGHKYDDLELSWLVEEMADDYMRNHDGWEIANNWHGDYRDFHVWDENKEFVGTFEVLMEYTPTFSAWKK